MSCDEELVKSVLSGNDAAFEILVDKYKGYIFAIILNFIKDRNEVENIAQEVFIQIYISLPKFKFDNFKGWIGKIAVSKSIDWKRKKARKYNEQPIEDTGKIEYNNSFQQCETPEDVLIKKENRQKIFNLCQSIPKIYSDTIIKFYFEEKTYEEIAKEEGTTVKTIASRLYRGRNILKKKWREENETL